MIVNKAGNQSRRISAKPRSNCVDDQMVEPRLSELQAFISRKEIDTPVYVYDLDKVEHSAERLATLASDLGIKLLYAIKACDVPAVVNVIQHYVDGYSCSSPHEVRLARNVSTLKDAHWISPLITSRDVGAAFRTCSNVTINSVSQLRLWLSEVLEHRNVGLRLNPLLSYVIDERYDPCREGSRLGVCASEIQQLCHRDVDLLQTVQGIHFHTNCDSVDGAELLSTVQSVIDQFGPFMPRLNWVNIGGGYLPNSWSSDEGLRKAVHLINRAWHCHIYFEPGADFVRDAGYLAGRVGDIVDTPSGKTAILDTSVNHWPEVFEYQFEPEVMGHCEGGAFAYTLAGRSCLAGDIFGEYTFNRRLLVNDIVFFSAAGAYSVVKAHRFNGLDMPRVVCMKGGEIVESGPILDRLFN